MRFYFFYHGGHHSRRRRRYSTKITSYKNSHINGLGNRANNVPRSKFALARAVKGSVESSMSEPPPPLPKTKRTIVNHRRSPFTTYDSSSIGDRFRKKKMLEVLGGFAVESRPGERSEKSGRTRSKAGKKSGVCGVRELYEKRGKWHDTCATSSYPFVYLRVWFTPHYRRISN